MLHLGALCATVFYVINHFFRHHLWFDDAIAVMIGSASLCVVGVIVVIGLSYIHPEDIDC